MRRVLRWVGVALLLAVGLAAAGFGLLQTGYGRHWLAGTIAHAASAPGFLVTIDDLAGTIPFDMRARRIAIADDQGVWLTLDDARIDLAALDLLTGTAHIRALTAARVAVARPPIAGPPTAPSEPLIDRLRVPHLPVAVTLDRLAIDHLTLAPPVLGETVDATIGGSAALGAGRARLALDLHRVDGTAGAIGLELALAGDPPVLTLRLTADEPTGLLLSRALGRTDRLPLSVSLTGEGPLAQWHGHFAASAGDKARIAADMAVAGTKEATVTLLGTAEIAPLLPPDIAPLVGDHATVALRATVGETGAFVLDAATIQLATVTLTGDAAVSGPDQAIAAHIRAHVPALAAAGGLLGQPAQGSADVTATIGGTERQPTLAIDAAGDDVRLGDAGAGHAEAHLTIDVTGDPADPAARIAIAGHGAVRGVVTPRQVALPAGLGRDLDWSFAASAARDGSAVELTRLTANGAGIDLSGSGRFLQGGRTVDGRFRLAIADLLPLSGAFGHAVAGALALDARIAQGESGGIASGVTGTIDGSIAGLRTGIPAADALAGGAVTIAGAGHREAGGAIVLDSLKLAGAGFTVDGTGRLDPATRQLAATLDAVVPRLQALSAALGTALAGRIEARATAGGSLDHPSVTAQIDGRDLVAAGARLDRLHLQAALPDAAQPQATIDGDVHGGGIDATLALAVDAGNGTDIVIPRLRLAASDGVIDGALRIDRATLLTTGTLRGKIPDLSRWTRLAGTPLAGSVDLKAGLDGRGGQSVDFTLDADHLSSGAGPARIAIGRFAAAGRLNDLLGTPSGKAQASVTAASFPSASFPSGGLATATLKIESTRPGRFVFTADAKGRLNDPLTLALGGEGEIAPRQAAIELRIARFDATIGSDHVRLTRPLTLSKRPGAVALSDLALAVDAGQITGNAALRGTALSLQLVGKDLPVAAAGRLVGRKNVGGTIGFDADLGGTTAAPHGHFTLAGRGLSVALRTQRLPSLAVDVEGDWQGRDLDLKGRFSGIKGAAMAFTGSVPLVLTAAPFGIAVPPQGRLAMRVEGSGDLGDLADLLPLGEDRLTGRFAVDAAIGGTVAAPAASGRVTITGGRYESFATGAVLTDLRLDLAGDRDRFTVHELSAADTAGGRITGSGSVVLTGSAGPSADFSLTLARFRLAARDEAVVTASGTVAVTGAIASPKVVARLSVDEADCTLPDTLPPSITRLKVIEVNGRGARLRPAAARAPAPAQPPALPAALDIRIAMPGRVFVRGRGLDSEWRGQLTITGTSAAPVVGGSLQSVRGTFDLLGKSFVVTQGSIGFGGGSGLDPTLDILAEVATADVTAQVRVSGTAAAPKVALSSTPSLPQDEILARVLFDRGVGQISVGEGLQVAQAAATLASGGPGMLDRLRSGLGLDRLSFGSAANGVASSTLNPAAGGSATGGTTGGTAVSGGKYVAKGVYVGATQGLTPQSSKVTVEIDVRPHVTVETDLSQTGGSGIGLNYKYDY